ncbi:MAG: hypothetical protein FD157_832 [Rhodocyclaceae bacterium]|nr:MAG: hypothetical protein FD157_832 [Rhodocyclaceae bacterium]TND05208.1 MAG: hypothetical protein FD118_612 [Rhodocyclaceae bacterium]
MKASRYSGLAMLGIALLGAGTTPAEESPSVVDPVQQREQIREQFLERMRSMTPEEQKLMRDSSADGRARMENSQRGQDAGMHGGYGRGYESRQGGSGRGMGGGRNR